LRLELKHACLEWDNGACLLDGVSFHVRDGELAMCVGATGSGKSGLLAAIIGELEPTGGKLRSRGRIAYVSQVAWIQNATLRDNILFGAPLDEARYAAVVHACALDADLEQLPAGDQTEIGKAATAPTPPTHPAVPPMAHETTQKSHTKKTIVSQLCRPLGPHDDQLTGLTNSV
jgi:ABC-type transport system involved in cytochrome bd biosynthesis fused ATPase/permease subunit